MAWSDYLPKFMRQERDETPSEQPTAQQPEPPELRAERIASTVSNRVQGWHKNVEEMPKPAAVAELIEAAGGYRRGGWAGLTELDETHRATARALLAEARTRREEAETPTIKQRRGMRL